MSDRPSTAVAVPPAAGTGIRTKKRSKWKDYLTSYLFLVPALSFLFVFSVLPIVYLVWLSFYEYRLPDPPSFVGTENYKQMLEDKLFFKSIFNTIKYTIGSMAVGLSAALFIAVLLHRKLRGLRFFKVLYFLPTITSEVITAMIFLWVFDHNLGIMNYVLKSSGVHEPPNWLLDPFWAMIILILIGAWRGAAYNTPIYLAALNSVPDTYFEAAKIDGANKWQQFRHISVPSIMPVITYTMILSVIGSFQVVAVVDVLTNGGPRDSTLVVIKHIWMQAFEFNNVGYGATLAIVLFPLLFFVTLLQLKLTSGRD